MTFLLTSQLSASIRTVGLVLLIATALMLPQNVNSTTPAPADSYKRVSFGVLGLYVPGSPPPKKVLELDGQNIEMLGFLAAINQLEDMEEFIISKVPPLNCYCHPATKVNEMLMVRTPKGKGIDFKSGIVKIRGTLHVSKNIKSEFDGPMYELECHEVL